MKRIYTHTFTPLSGPAIVTDVDLQKLIAIARPPEGSSVAHLHVLQRKPIELWVNDVAQLEALRAAWEAYLAVEDATPALIDALKVVRWTPHILRHLQKNDSMALNQVDSALQKAGAWQPVVPRTADGQVDFSGVPSALSLRELDDQMSILTCHQSECREQQTRASFDANGGRCVKCGSENVWL